MKTVEKGEREKVQCNGCGEYYKSLALHWHHSDCQRPDFNQRQKEVLKGLLMGDGSVVETDSNARIQVSNTNLQFLEWLEDEFPVMTTGIRVEKTVEETEERWEGSGSRWEDYDFQTLYRLSFRSHPYFSHLREKWYDESGERSKTQFPPDLELSPMSLRVWYCSDGHVDRHRTTPQIEIVSSNEMDRRKEIENLFRDIGVDVTYSGYEIYIRKNQREEFLDYIGNPIPGFEEKWDVWGDDE